MLILRRSIVVETLLAECPNSESPRPCYFYCSRTAADAARSDPTQILRCLARQLSCVQDYDIVSKVCVDLYKHGKEHSSQGPSLKQTIQLIIQLLAHRPRSCIILDALDECSLESRGILFDALHRIVQESSSETRVFISSRDEQDIKIRLTPDKVIAAQNKYDIEVIASQNRHDINVFVEDEVSKVLARKAILYGDIDGELILSIKDVLKQGANGMCVPVVHRVSGSDQANVGLLGFAGSNCSYSIYVRCVQERRFGNASESCLES